MQQPIESQARDAFFAHYVSEGSRGWDFLIPYRYSEADFLNRSVDAVSLAFVGHQRTSKSIMDSAQVQFGMALRSLSRAITYTNLASSNELLSAALLLDLFTKLTCAGPGDLTFWRAHLNGALALIDALGLQNLQDQISLRILSRFVINSITSCVASATIVPEQLNNIWTHVTRLMARGDDPKWKMTQVMINYASLRAAIQDNIGSLEDQVAMAQLLDQRLLQISKNFPHGWQPTKYHIHDPASQGPSQYASYRDRHITQSWNVLRLTRILVNEFLVENGDRHDKGDRNEGQACEMPPMKTITTLVDEIVYSVYQYAGLCCAHHKSSPKSTAPIPTKPHYPKTAHSPKQTLDCYTLIFPLYVAGRSKFASSSQRETIIRDLRFINDHMCIGNASVVADTIEKEPGKDPWQVFAILGSYGFAA